MLIVTLTELRTARSDYSNYARFSVCLLKHSRPVLKQRQLCGRTGTLVMNFVGTRPCYASAEHRIMYKLCLLLHLVHIGQAPQYLTDCVSTVSSAGSRYRLKSTDTADYVLPRTKFGERGFCYSGPVSWNSLPSELHDICDTKTLKTAREGTI